MRWLALIAIALLLCGCAVSWKDGGGQRWCAGTTNPCQGSPCIDPPEEVP
jgi:hypothetical protein